ncbi:MAG TPA: Trk system potassium transporter TrkA, partial [Desulfobulbus sp.]|nr:Trk system potassium transporter TrkA [Desulfobulbus sp.]
MRIMIVGAGLVGQYLCSKFSSEGQDVILIDRDKDKLLRIEKEMNILTVHGSGASARILAEAGIAKTDLFIAVTDSDEVNLVACIMSRQYDVGIRIARVRNEDFLTPGMSLNEEALGIDLLISPDWAMADEIMKLIHVSEAFDTAEFAKGKVILLGYVVQANNPHVGKSLFELGKEHGTHHYVMTAIIRDGETIIPRGEDTIRAGDKIYLMVLREEMARVEQMFNFASRLPGKVFIIGGGDIGYLVARRLEELDIEIKIVEEDVERCRFLSENLAHTIVLNFDGLDAHDLLEEGIDLADLVIAVTGSDTTNILSSLLAKHHGTRRCITKITRHDFVPMLGKLGID